MKKVLLAVLCAGLFFACGKKKAQEPEALMDTVPTQQEEVVQQEPEEVAEPVADEPVSQTTTPAAKKPAAKKTTTPTKAEQQGIQSVGDNSTAKTKADQPAAVQTKQEDNPGIVNTGKKKR